MDKDGDYYGCSDIDGTQDNCSNSAVLSSDDFSYKGVDYDIDRLYFHSGYLTLEVKSSKRAIKTALGSLTLNVGSLQFAVSDAEVISNAPIKGIRWSAPGLGWTHGQQVSLSLTGPWQPPSAPTNLRAAASGQNVVNLSWTAPDENYNPTSPETAYELQWSLDGSTWKHLVNPGGTSYTHFCVTPGTKYYYRVRAYNRGGSGPWSNTATATPSSTAEVISPGWTHIPRNPDFHNFPLGPGESFRLLFVTSSKRGAGDTNIASYNSVARGAGNALGSFKSVSCALISTESVDARDNTATTGAGVPIYWVDGGKVANNYSEFYDGSWDSNNPTYENGRPVVSGAEVWTGSQSDGYGDGGNRAGASEVTYGLPGTGNQELNSGQASSGEEKRLYVLSPVIKVFGEQQTRSGGGGTPPSQQSNGGGTPPPSQQQSGGGAPPPSQQPSGGGGTSPSQSSPTEPGDTAPQQCEETDFDCADVRGLKERECDALVALYDATCGAGWNWTNLDPQKTKWFATPLAARWQGITIEEMSVRDLVLSGKNLRGELPEELADLEGLVVLDLSSNQELTGDLPRERPEELLRVDIRGTKISRPDWADRIDDFRPGPRITTRTIKTSGGGCAIASGKDEGSVPASALLGLLLVAWVLPGVFKKTASRPGELPPSVGRGVLPQKPTLPRNKNSPS